MNLLRMCDSDYKQAFQDIKSQLQGCKVEHSPGGFTLTYDRFNKQQLQKVQAADFSSFEKVSEKDKNGKMTVKYSYIKIVKPEKEKTPKRVKESYKNLASGYPQNFWLCLASKVCPILLDKKNENKDQTTTTFKINGNSIEFSYPTLSLKINSTPLESQSSGITWFKECVIDAFAKESQETLSIKRPEGRTRADDRLEFKKAVGTFFPSIVNQLPYASGTQDLGSMKKGTASKKLFLTESDYNKYNPEGFVKHTNSNATYYTKDNVNVIDITPDSPSRAMYALNNPGLPKQAAYIARSPLAPIVTASGSTSPYVVVSGSEAFQVEVSSMGDIKVRNINVKQDLAKEIAKNFNSKDVDPIGVAYKDWLAENHYKPSQSKFNEFKELEEFKHLFDSTRG